MARDGSGPFKQFRVQSISLTTEKRSQALIKRSKGAHEVQIKCREEQSEMQSAQSKAQSCKQSAVKAQLLGSHVQ